MSAEVVGRRGRQWNNRISYTSVFWPRVRARALRAPVFWNSLPCQTGAARPTRPSQLHCFLFDPKNKKKSIELGPPTWRAFQKINAFLQAQTWASHVKGFFLSTGPHRLWNRRPPAPCPAHRSFADPSGNVLGSKLCTGATIRPNFYRFFPFFI